MEIPEAARADPRVMESVQGEPIVFAVRGRRAPLAQCLGYGFLGATLVAIWWTLWTTRTDGERFLSFAFTLAGLPMLAWALHGALSRVWFVGTPTRFLVVRRRRTDRRPWTDFVEEVALVQGARGRGSILLRARVWGRPRSNVQRTDAPEDADGLLEPVALRGIPQAAEVARSALRLIAGDAPSSSVPSAAGLRVPPVVAALLGGEPPVRAVRTRGPIEGRGWLLLTVALMGAVVLGMAFLLRVTVFGVPDFGNGIEGLTVRTTGDDAPADAQLMTLLFSLFIVPLSVGCVFGLWKAITLRSRVWLAREGVVFARGRDARLVRWSRVAGLDVRGNTVILTLARPSDLGGPDLPPARLAFGGLRDAEAVVAAVTALRGPLPAVLA